MSHHLMSTNMLQGAWFRRFRRIQYISMPAHLRLTALCDVNSSNKCSKGASRSSLTSYFCGQLYCPSFQNHLYFVDGCKELKLRMAGETGNTGKGNARIVY